MGTIARGGKQLRGDQGSSLLLDGVSPYQKHTLDARSLRRQLHRNSIMAAKTELILICLVVVALLMLLARKIRLPYPILLTVGGVLLALVPGLPTIQLEPELIFNLFLPPLLYPAAVYTSWRDLRVNLRSILWMAIVLVLITMAVVAGLIHYLVGLPLAVAFVFGALIAPPDAVAALSVTQTLRVPRRIIVILEGESLLNDATAFISFRFAVAAVMTGSFSIGHAGLRYLAVAAGGVAVGIATGWLATQVQKRLDDPPVQTMLSLLTPYVAFFGAERLHVSGILAVVIAGIYYGWQAPRFLSGRMRLQALPVWEILSFILNGILFVLIGLQLPQVVHALPSGAATGIVKIAIVVVLAMTIVRFLWMFGADSFGRLVNKKRTRRHHGIPWQQTALISWIGMRGAGSLAGALAIPLVLPNGQPFPGRDMILLLTFCVILGTLILQGLPLALLIRWLRITDDHATDKEERLARLKANEAALARLEEIGLASPVSSETVQRLRSEYADRVRQLQNDCCDDENVPRLYSRDFEELAREVLRVERNTVLALRNEEAISDHALRRIQRDIDLAEARLHQSA